MPLFVLIVRDGPEGLALRKQCREAHLENLRPLAEAGRVRYAGPLRDEAGDPCGSVIVFQAESLSHAQAFAASDPYATEGVFATTEVFETLQVFPEETAGA